MTGVGTSNLALRQVYRPVMYMTVAWKACNPIMYMIVAWKAYIVGF